ncbi:MAG: hypothetical protein ACQES4_05770 [Bacillota bacterium]
MLKRASKKASEQLLEIAFYQQDLRQLCLPEKYDLALLFQDGKGSWIISAGLVRNLKLQERKFTN